MDGLFRSGPAAPLLQPVVAVSGPARGQLCHRGSSLAIAAPTSDAPPPIANRALAGKGENDSRSTPLASTRALPIGNAMVTPTAPASSSPPSVASRLDRPERTGLRVTG
jgi:hypothetical protein